MKRIVFLISLLMTLMCVSVNAQTKKGDLTGDGKIDKNDVICLVRKILSFAEEETNDDDINQDGMVNIEDITSLVDLIVSYPCPDRHHPHVVDLGLPSGTKWACCNVGASSPKERGYYYAWGETEEKELYLMETYPYYDTNEDEFIDLGNISGTKYDAAHVKWGGDWRMPTREEAEELFELTKEQQYISDIKQEVFLGPNGNCIYVPYTDTQFGLYKTEIECTWPMIWTSTLQDNIMAAYMGGGSCARYAGIPVRPVYDPSAFAFSLSEESVDMFVNSTRSVFVEMGSGEYELQYDQTDIIDAELIMADKEEAPDAKDEIDIYGIAEGTAQLKVVDKGSNKTVTIDVNVKTPTAEDIENTRNYIANVGSFINIQGESDVDAFKNNLLSWLNEQEWVKHTNLSLDKNQIMTTFENGFDFLFVFQDMSFFEDSEESQNARLSAPLRVDTDEHSFDVSFQEGEEIIKEKNKILYFNCLNNYMFDLDEYNGIMQECKSSPVLIDVVKEDYDFTKFIRNDYSDYGIVMISNTHGTPNGSFIVGTDKTLPEIPIGGYLIGVGIINEINKILPPQEIMRITPKELKIKYMGDADPILYGNYCWSYNLKEAFPNLPVVGYDNLSRYNKNKKYGQLYIHGLLNGEYHSKAMEKLVVYDWWRAGIFYGQWLPLQHIFTHTETNKKSFRRFFSISMDDVTEYTGSGPVITGKINGYENLKSGIQFYAYVFDKDKQLNPADITKGQRITINEDGSFNYAYPGLLYSEYPKELQYVVGFTYRGAFYYGPVKLMEVKGFCPDANHPHIIDLGLPSGTKWSCCNVGASTYADVGTLFAWGDPSGEYGIASYDAYTYEGRYREWTDENGIAYNNHSDCLEYWSHFGGLTPSPNICGSNIDMATANLGSNWRLPTKEQLEELINPNYTFIDPDYRRWQKGVRVLSKINGCSLYLPIYSITSHHVVLIWSGNSRKISDNTFRNGYAYDAYFLWFVCGFLSENPVSSANRNRRKHVRPVYCGPTGGDTVP